MSLKLRATVGLAAAVLVWSMPAMAQETSSGYADGLPDVRDRYDGIGIHAGSFWVLPTVETGYFYNSNIYARSNNVVGDGGIYIKPHLDVKSDWGRHALNLALDFSQYEYFDHSSQSLTNFSGAIDGRIDVRRDLVILGGLKGGLFEDPLGDLNVSTAAAEPTRHNDLDAWTSINKSFNHLSVSLGGAYKVYDYFDVASTPASPTYPADVDQDFRDGNTFETGGRVFYKISPGYSIFADARYNWRDYFNDSSQNSNGWRGLTGVQFELDRLISGDIGVGYMEQDYSDGSNANGFSYHAGLTWNPTPLMTVKLDADRTIQDSTYQNSSGSIQDMVKLGLDYEVLRGLILSPHASVGFEDYEDINREEQVYGAGVKLDYVINRFASLGAALDYSQTNVDDPADPNGDWDRYVVGLYAKARF